MNGLSHLYQLGESTVKFREIRSDFELIQVFNEISPRKQDSPRGDAAFCGVTFGAILFAYVTKIGRQDYMC